MRIQHLAGEAEISGVDVDRDGGVGGADILGSDQQAIGRAGTQGGGKAHRSSKPAAQKAEAFPRQKPGKPDTLYH